MTDIIFHNTTIDDLDNVLYNYSINDVILYYRDDYNDYLVLLIDGYIYIGIRNLQNMNNENFYQFGIYLINDNINNIDVLLSFIEDSELLEDVKDVVINYNNSLI